jgi:hypothetical protein
MKKFLFGNKMNDKKTLNQKFNSLWEQVIEWKKLDIEYYRKNNNQEMVEFSQKVLEKTQNEYKKVKIKTS